MRYAIISDIHANLEALEAVLESIVISQNSIDDILCLGDIIGYGPNPNECLNWIRCLEIPTVIGNHDFVILDSADLENFNEYAEAASHWTKSVLSPENIRYLACLPFSLKLPDILMVHSAPAFPRKWDYITDIITALGEFRCFEEKFCLIGHSHVPIAFSDDGDCFQEDFGAQTCPPAGGAGHKYIVNAGSVGQPRDKNPKACYGVLDTDSLTFSWTRVIYDINKTARKIKGLGLPDFLAERLFLGK